MKKIILLGFMLSALSIHAQDRMFTYAYQSNVLNKGQKELEVWTTMYNGREHFYRGFKHRLEFEVGLGSKLQTAFYLNNKYSTGIKNTNSIETLSTSSGFSFSNEWKLKLSDPVANKIGSALYFEYGLGKDDIELEGKLIFDKQIGKTIQTFNIVGELELENEYEYEGTEIEVEIEKEKVIEFNYGLSFQKTNNLSFGFEFLNKNIIDKNAIALSLLYGGPCVSYSFEGFWLNLTVLPQITNFKTGKTQLTEGEKLQTRLAFSYVF